jgi:hypothetical protein
VSNAVPIRTRLAERVADIEQAIPDAQERAQVVKDAQAFFEVMLPPGEHSLEWTEEDLMLFAEAFVEQSGAEAGEVRFRNMLRVLGLLQNPKRTWGGS